MDIWTADLDALYLPDITIDSESLDDLVQMSKDLTKNILHTKHYQIRVDGSCLGSWDFLVFDR